MQRQHCLVVDKLVACHDKEKLATEKSADKMIRKKRLAHDCLVYNFTNEKFAYVPMISTCKNL